MDADRTGVRAGENLWDYVQPSVAVDVAALALVPDDSNTLRLGVVVVLPEGEAEWRLPGAFVRAPKRWEDPASGPRESPRGEIPPLRAAVDRALAKAGLAGRVPQQLSAFDRPDRDERGWVISVAHVDTLPLGASPTPGPGHQLAIARLEKHNKALRAVIGSTAVALHFDHAEIISQAVAQLRRDYTSSADPGHFLGEEFTLLDLRLAHEAVAGKTLPIDTFRRQHMGYLAIGLDRETEGRIGKPAEIFRRRRASDKSYDPKTMNHRLAPRSLHP